jgi:hypothetical protein
MSKWEARNEKHAARLLVGDYFGDRPEDELDTIRIAKKNRAAYLCKKMGCNKESVVLEIRSGSGRRSNHCCKFRIQIGVKRQDVGANTRGYAKFAF